MRLNLSGYQRGVFFLFLMMGVSCFCDIIAKFMGQRLDAMEVIFFRFFFGLVTLLPFMATRGMKIFRTKQLGFNVIRGVLGALSFFLYTYSVIHIPLAEVVTILWTIPLFGLVLSIFFLGESVPLMRWAATLIGFLGLSFITLYDSGASVSVRLLYAAPIASSLLFAVQDVMIKKIVDQEDRVTMLLYFALVASLLTLVPMLFVWKTPTAFEATMLLLLGFNGNLMQYLIFKAFSATDLSALAPYRYVEFLFSSFFGFVFFAEIPGLNVLIGALILVPSTLYLAYTENQSKAGKLQTAA
ncbi:MAG: DMT family transporter [Holosporaceae bacterium]|jgi:S-adenosylmethionine uptake transporter|nr:DMT family transporter [Holosporaceae bacterium]